MYYADKINCSSHLTVSSAVVSQGNILVPIILTLV